MRFSSALLPPYAIRLTIIRCFQCSPSGVGPQTHVRVTRVSKHEPLLVGPKVRKSIDVQQDLRAQVGLLIRWVLDRVAPGSRMIAQSQGPPPSYQRLHWTALPRLPDAGKTRAGGSVLWPTLETKQQRHNRSKTGTRERKGGGKEANVFSGTRLSTRVNGRHLSRSNRPPLLASGCVVLELSYMSEYNVAGFATSDVDSSNSGLTTPASSQSNAIGPPKWNNC